MPEMTVAEALEWEEQWRDVPISPGNGDGRAMTALAAEVRRLQGQTCETCRHQVTSRDIKAACVKLGHEDVIYCEDVGGGCRAWERKS